MAYLLDSNILIRQFDIVSPLRSHALASTEALIKAKMPHLIGHGPECLIPPEGGPHRPPRARVRNYGTAAQRRGR